MFPGGLYSRSGTPSPNHDPEWGGTKVQSRIRIQNPEFESRIQISGFWFEIPDWTLSTQSEFWIPVSGFRFRTPDWTCVQTSNPDFRFPVSGFKFRIGPCPPNPKSGFRFPVSNSGLDLHPDFESRIQISGFRFPVSDSGLDLVHPIRFPDSGFRFLVSDSGSDLRPDFESRSSGGDQGPIRNLNAESRIRIPNPDFRFPA
jgi:hypothetical protein